MYNKNAKKQEGKEEKEEHIGVYRGRTTTTDGLLNHDLYLKRLFRYLENIGQANGKSFRNLFENIPKIVRNRNIKQIKLGLQWNMWLDSLTLWSVYVCVFVLYMVCVVFSCCSTIW